ncbi:hypothetical protein IFR05_014436 [Cadophora sp. M221]|nr:hypothetical protein IFR05_014436 [Cadophora sp. M221]
MDEEPIYKLAVECEKLFKEKIARLNKDSKTNDAAILSELYERFASWAASLFVFGESEICLDRKLCHHVEIQGQFLRLLDIMKRNLEYGMVSAVHPKEPTIMERYTQGQTQ